MYRLIALIVLAGLLVGCQNANETAESPVAPTAVPTDGPDVAEATVSQDDVRQDAQEAPMEIDADHLAELNAGNRAFALAALHNLLVAEPEEDNLLVSPHSILSALAMVYAGAEGQTREEIRETLQFRLPEPALHQAFQALDAALADRRQDGRDDQARGFELNVVNRLWGDQDYEFVPDYLALVERYYGAGLERVDFAGNHEGARQQINRWVEEVTRDRIQDLLPMGVLDEDTRLVLVNAIYFLASWQDAFEESQTVQEPFRSLDGSTVDVPMMKRVAHLPAYLGTDTTAVAIPYLGGDVSFLALMPSDGSQDFEQWQSSISVERFDEIVAGLQGQRVDLSLPRFRSEGSFRLSDMLQSMGMRAAFSRPDANFERMTGVGPGVVGRSLYIDEVFHKTFIDLDEVGTEAAAATAVVMMRVTSMPIEDDPTVVRFDRPFLFAVYDHPTGSILFLGRQGQIGRQ